MIATMSLSSRRLGRPVLLGLIGLAMVLGVTGCVSVGSGYGALDREAEAGDALPADLPNYAYDDLVMDSARLVGEHDTNRLYLARGTRSAICILVYPDNVNWVVACGGDRGWLGVTGPSGNYLVVPEGAVPPGDATPVAPNVFAAG